MIRIINTSKIIKSTNTNESKIIKSISTDDRNRKIEYLELNFKQNTWNF